MNEFFENILLFFLALFMYFPLSYLLPTALTLIGVGVLIGMQIEKRRNK
jgi:hypothetical protein